MHCYKTNLSRSRLFLTVYVGYFAPRNQPLTNLYYIGNQQDAFKATKMTTELHIRFYDKLNDFLPYQKRNQWAVYVCPATSTIKDAIEAAGVPHAEVNGIRVNNTFTNFEFLPRTKDRIEVFPLHTQQAPTGMVPLMPALPPVPRFVLDVHLGRLARQLRMFGFDALYERDYADDQIAQISATQNRIVLTRDLPLLKRNLVKWGYWLRSQVAEEQLLEVFRQFGLPETVRTFYRCIDCNGIIGQVSRRQ